ncbi:LuxR C-terminal-related transcriptional regulator [Gluconacetobacter sp. Hr-1-5]|uniref:LuxR C-terminal-related transcriptional regulator n=1 Tax=Gluconacetobacter sp. Hr-1-5 TaxID=3395370 RepID=UPI003B522331
MLPQPGRPVLRRLSPPIHYLRLCTRTLILRSLDVARQGRLTIILGPPGYGKTSVLTQWHARLTAAGVNVAWYSALETEREPLQFLRMLVLALEAGHVDPGDAARRILFDGDTDAALDALALGLDNLPQPVTIILDDFDKVDHPRIIECLSMLVEATSEHVHFVLSTRHKPALPIALLRAQGSVRVIEPGELKLRGRELADALDLPEDAPELAAIAEQTEGWPIAVQLYRLWRERVGGMQSMPRFSGLASEMADYFAEQIFGHLSACHQAALIELSIVDVIELSLADHVRDAYDSAHVLQQVARALPSLVQQSILDGEVGYRLHPLLAEYARGRLAVMPGRMGVLHARAAIWFERQRRYVDAVRHAVQSKDDGLLQLLLSRLPFLEVFLSAGVGHLRAIIREIPAMALQDSPRMRLAAILVYFKEGFHREAAQMVSAMVEESDRLLFSEEQAKAERERFLTESRALMSFFAVDMLGPLVLPTLSVATLREQSANMPMMWGWYENLELVLQQQIGEIDAAALALERARTAYGTIDGLHHADMHLVCHEILLDLARGDLHRVKERNLAVRRRLPVHMAGERSLHAMARIADACIEYLQTYRPSAAEEMRIALFEFGRNEAWFDQYALALPVIVEVSFRRHGRDPALKELAVTAADLRQRGMEALEGLLSALALFVHARSGDVPAELEARCRDLVMPPASDRPWLEREWCLRALAMVALIRDTPDEAEKFSEELIRVSRSGGRLVGEVWGMVLGARVALWREDRDVARGMALQAVQLSQQQQIVAPFAEIQDGLAELLGELVEEMPSEFGRRHIDAILRAIANERSLTATDALSDREAEIMAHVADGASNKLIARRLGISDNTVKFHLKKIYAKLGVSGRKAAVARFDRAR